MQKQCRGCLVTLPISGFYRHSQMADGYLNFCKECVRRRVATHRENFLDEIRAYDRARGKTEYRRAKVRAYKNLNARWQAHKSWALRNPRKVAASTAVHNAVRSGKLVKGPCEVCGDRIVQGHHDDYTKPLEVRWLCDLHHKEHHNRLREMERAA